MEIKVLGTGCKKCNELYQRVKDAVQEMDVEAEIIKVQEIKDIAEYGVMMMPGLVVNDKVKVAGRVPGREEIKKWIKEEK